MARTYESLHQEKRLQAESSLVKSYLLEAHLSEDADGVAVRKTLDSAIATAPSRKGDSARVRKTDEERFFQVEIAQNREKVVLFVDASNPRFWVMHSLSNSVQTDAVVTRLTQSPELDRAWLFGQFLERISRLGSFRGLGLDYDRRKVADTDLDASDAPVSFLKMQLWHSRASDVLKVLREQFPSATALAKVKVKYWQEGNPEDFCLDDVKYNGKITARGTSFNTHMALVATVYTEYAELVRTVEKRYRLRWSGTAGRMTLDGSPVSFVFSRPVVDLEKFCDLVFSATVPFRLWGVPVRVADGFYRVAAIDLHVGSRIDFELTQEYVRVYVGAETCGNTLVRFFTNLQHYYDAQVEAVDGDGADVFDRKQF